MLRCNIACRARALTAFTALALSTSAYGSGLAVSEWRPVKLGELVLPDGVDIFVGFKAGGQLLGLRPL